MRPDLQDTAGHTPAPPASGLIADKQPVSMIGVFIPKYEQQSVYFK